MNRVAASIGLLMAVVLGLLSLPQLMTLQGEGTGLSNGVGGVFDVSWYLVLILVAGVAVITAIGAVVWRS